MGIVIVNYNSEEEIRLLLSSLKTLNYRNFFIVIIDNCSPNGSGSLLKKGLNSQSNIEVILCPENRGFAAGVNIGVRNAIVRGADYLWILNPDIVTVPDTLSELVSASIKNSHAGAFGSKILYPNKEEGAAIWGIGGTLEREKLETRMIGHKEHDKGQYDQIREVDYLPGCSLFIPKETISRAGYFPEEFFMYYEETRWCQTVRSLGLSLLTVPKSKVTHCFNDEKLNAPFCVYYFNRNNRLFWWQISGPKLRFSIYLTALLKTLPKESWALLNSLFSKRREIFFAHLKSTVDFLLFRLGKQRFSLLKDKKARNR